MMAENFISEGLEAIDAVDEGDNMDNIDVDRQEALREI